MEKRKQTLSDWVKRGATASPPDRLPTGTPEISEVVQVLSGDLSDKSMSWLLMAAQHYDVTGRLFVGPAACNVTLQFGLGAPVHAYSPFCTGAEAVMDLFIWKDGKVRFEPGKPPDSASIQESVEELVSRGEDYIRNLAFLGQHGISELSFLLRPSGRLNDGELRQRLAVGKPIDLNLQTDFFGSVYGTANLKDVAERLNLPQSQWVAIATNLLELGLLIAPNGCSLKLPDHRHEGGGFPTIQMNVPPTLAPSPLPATVIPGEVTQKFTKNSDTSLPRSFTAIESAEHPPLGTGSVQMGVPPKLIALDPSKTEVVWALLKKPDTGILTAEALHFFLDREFARAYRFKTSLSLVLFCVKLNATADGCMSPADCALLTTAVNKVKREVDMMGHFGPQVFGLLLPSVDAYQACVLVDRINTELPNMVPELGRYRPSLHFGIASVPLDATDLIGLVQTAQRAMFDAANLNILKVQANQSNKPG